MTARTVTLSVTAFVDIDMALRGVIAQAKERMKFMPMLDGNEAGRKWEVDQLKALMVAHAELTGAAS